MKPRVPVVFERLDLLEWQLCRRLGRLNLYRPWLMTLRLASRLGDWPAWAALVLAQPVLHGQDGGPLMGQYLLTALVAVAFYRLIKTRLCRERPYITFVGAIACSEPARDRYSFPSGHTLHAVMFSLLTASHAPGLLPLVLPLAGMIAISRVGLGLHYPSDVLAGGMIGAAFALGSLALFG